MTSALEADGKIVVAGQSYDRGYDMAVWVIERWHRERGHPGRIFCGLEARVPKVARIVQFEATYPRTVNSFSPRT